VQAVGAGLERARGRLARPGVLEERQRARDERAGRREDPLRDALAERLQPRAVRRTGFADERVVERARREAAAAERRALDEDQVHWAVRRAPVVEREVRHAPVAAVPQVVAPGDELRE